MCGRSDREPRAELPLPPEQHDAILAALPRRDFKRQIIRAFAGGIAHKPETAFGNVKADVLARELPGYVRTDFCSLILDTPFAE